MRLGPGQTPDAGESFKNLGSAWVSCRETHSQPRAQGPKDQPLLPKEPVPPRVLPPPLLLVLLLLLRLLLLLLLIRLLLLVVVLRMLLPPPLFLPLHPGRAVSKR